MKKYERFLKSSIHKSMESAYMGGCLELGAWLQKRKLELNHPGSFCWDTLRYYHQCWEWMLEIDFGIC